MQVLAQQITKQETCNRDKIHNKEKTSLFQNFIYTSPNQQTKLCTNLMFTLKQVVMGRKAVNHNAGKDWHNK